MLTLTDYLDGARARSGLTSDRQLARSLALENASVSRYRSGKELPSDDTMIGLAELAGIPAEQALLDLNTWRTKSDRARSVYRRLAEKAVAAALLLGIFIGGFPGEGNAMATDGQRKSVAVYYGKLLRALIRRLRSPAAVAFR